MNTSKSLKSILWTIPENHDGRTNEQVIDEASAAIVEAVEGLIGEDLPEELFGTPPIDINGIANLEKWRMRKAIKEWQ